MVVHIFNRVNSGGTKLSKRDLALAKICADGPEARDTMKTSIGRWRSEGCDFTLDWLLRSVNTILTGEAKFLYLHTQEAGDIASALKRAVKHIDSSLNMIGGRLGLDHDRVFSRSSQFPSWCGTSTPMAASWMRKPETSYSHGSRRPACGGASPDPSKASSTRTWASSTRAAAISTS